LVLDCRQDFGTIQIVVRNPSPIAHRPGQREVFTMAISSSSVPGVPSAPSSLVAAVSTLATPTEVSLGPQDTLFRVVLESLSDGVVVADAEGRFIHFNAAAGKILGTGMTDATLDQWSARYGCFLPDRVTPFPPHELPLARALRGEAVYDGEVFVRHAGRPQGVWVSINASPLRDGKGNLIGGVAVFRDVTARKRLDDALAQTADELARSNQDLQQFAYVVSHDLQQPLRQVSRFCQLLEEHHKDKLDGQGQGFLRCAIEGAARMQRLIHDVLIFARVDRSRPRAIAVDLRSVFCKALSDLSGAAEATIVVESLPTLRVDPTQIGQVALNLLGNALKYRKAQAPHIRVTAQRQASDWLFAVQDDGIGIEPEALRRVFGAFERAAPAAYPGTGLGLAICKRIVENHGGRIWAESQPGQGTTVYFTLPAN
jgi:PAS domain S-box-containing protein